jgi:NitT/TauT family transport system permease protein
MNVLNNEVNEQTATAPESKEVTSYKKAHRRRRIQVNILRVLLFVVVIGGWEFGARWRLPGAKDPVIDPFFWGQPSGIRNQLVTWVTQGTAQGTLWEQIAVTLEEAISLQPHF